MARNRSEAAFAALEAELSRERAATLGRLGRKLETALQRCEELAARLDASPPTTDAERTRELLRKAVRDAEELRWMFCVQRESMGLTDHGWVYRLYPLPAAP